MSVDILTNAKFDEKIDELITEIKKGIGNSDLFQKVGDEQIRYGEGDCSSAINDLGDEVGEIGDVINKNIIIAKNLTNKITSQSVTIKSASCSIIGDLAIFASQIITNTEIPINGLMLTNIPLKPVTNGRIFVVNKHNYTINYNISINRTIDDAINEIHNKDIPIPANTEIRMELFFRIVRYDGFEI